MYARTIVHSDLLVIVVVIVMVVVVVRRRHVKSAMNGPSWLPGAAVLTKTRTRITGAMQVGGTATLASIWALPVVLRGTPFVLAATTPPLPPHVPVVVLILAMIRQREDGKKGADGTEFDPFIQLHYETPS
jgi:hypothetical protein